MTNDNLIFDNQNNTGTNIFETSTGVVNVAPVKISGNYKIYVSSRKNGYKLYLKDYTDRSLVLDVTKEFIPQVCNFLQTSVITSDTSKYRYGGFQQKGIKSWHIPLYIGYKNPTPKYFVILKTNNDNNQNIYNESQIVDVIDLDKIHLTNIFKSIDTHFDYPISFDFDEQIVNIHGYDANQSCSSIKNFEINEYRFNELNQKILDSYENSNMFFGRFVNLEFEFDYDTNDDTTHFNNFYGFLAYDLESLKFVDVYKKETNDNYIDFRRVIGQPETYQIESDSLYVTDVNPQDYLYKLYVMSYMVGDKFEFYRDENLVFSYTIKQSDVRNTKLETITRVADMITQNSNNIIECHCVSDIATKMSFESSFPCEIEIKNSSGNVILGGGLRYMPFDIGDKVFKNITINDLMIVRGSCVIDTNKYKRIKIDRTQYNIVDSFERDGKYYIRINTTSPIKSATQIILIEEKLEQRLKLSPIQFMQYESNLISQKFCEPRRLEGNEIIGQDNTRIKYHIKGEYQYADDMLSEYVATIDDTPKLMFNMCGSTCFITPYILNTHKNFYETAGSLNYDFLNKSRDVYRFNWFLIKSLDYYNLKPNNDVRHLRYFGVGEYQKPRLTSRLSKISSDKCETTFLGVKYQLPIEFRDWQFCVVYDPSFKDDAIDVNYKVEANVDEQTVYLIINKYMKYNDFFGDEENKLIDISFLLNVSESMNTSEPHPQSAIKIGFHMTSEITSFDSVGKILIKNNSNINYNLYFYEGQDVEFSYPIRLKTGENSWEDTQLFNVVLKNVTDLTQNTMYCDDIIITLYPEKIYKYDGGYYGNPIEKEEYYTFADESERDLIDRFYQIITEIDPENKHLFYSYNDIPDNAPDYKSYEISFKKNYYRINYNPDGSVEIKLFPEFYKDFTGFSDEEIIDWFEDKTNISNDTEGLISYRNIEHDHVVSYDIFHSNLVMSGIKLLCQDIHCTTANLASVRTDIEQLSLNNFINHSLQNPLELYYKNRNGEITNSGTIKITPIYPIENTVLWIDENNDTTHFSIKRFNGQYNVYLQGIKSKDYEIQFQTKPFRVNNRLFSMYDQEFGKYLGITTNDNVTATGIWKEIEGNLLSTLFTKTNDITRIETCESNEIDYKDIIKKYVKTLTANNYIIKTNNEHYLSTLTINVNEYIHDRYSLYLLEHQYELVEILSNNKRIHFEFGDGFVVNVGDIYIGEKLKFVFKKK